MRAHVEPLPPEYVEPATRGRVRNLDIPPPPAYPRAVEQGDTTDGEWLVRRSTAGDEFGYMGVGDPYVADDGVLYVDMTHFARLTWVWIARLSVERHVDPEHVCRWRARETFLQRPLCVYGGCQWASGAGRLCDVHEAQWKAGEPLTPRRP